LGIRGKICLLPVILFCLCNIVNAQTNIIHPVPVENIRDSFVNKPNRPIPPPVSQWDKKAILLDSLKEKASKNKITRELYNLVVVSSDTSAKIARDMDSDIPYRLYSGKKIRRIIIRRLNVFGADIDKPEGFKPTSGQKILNKTHVNTSERIIRNNLLFSEGDTLAPIRLSDNERILRDLSFIDDARIKVVPVSEDEVDVLVITKDIYSLGGDYSPSGLKKGTFSAFENNLFGMGHELGIIIPYDNSATDSPGFGIHYIIDNIYRSFINFNVFFHNGIGTKMYGFDLSRKFVSHSTKYAGGISIHNVSENVDLDILKQNEHYNLQDYWLARSFLLNHESVTRLIIGTRYTNNNVFDRPLILPDSYYTLQNYRLYLGSVALSTQKYFKANLVHEYGRIEDIPYGGMLKVTIGREFNEFKVRNYAGSELSAGTSFPEFGYLYASAGLGAFINNGSTEQGISSLRVKYFSNLIPIGRYMVRNFIKLDYTRGFDRNTDEHLNYYNDNGFSGFRNDSVSGEQRFTINFEAVFFSPGNVYGFRFAFFTFADVSSLAGTNQILAHGTTLSGIGLGIRVRNDNLIFHTFQIRIGFFPDIPAYSRVNNIVFSGEEPHRFENFESGPPSMIPYR
jgi:hypothetical protein